MPGKPTAKQLVTIAKKMGWPIRTNGGHCIVTTPDKKIIVVQAPGRGKQKSQIDDQVKQARASGMEI